MNIFALLIIQMEANRALTKEEVKQIDAIPMCFMVGKERSGTTLLQAMLNAHPNIIAPPESRFIVLLYHRYGKTRIWSENTIINFCNDLFREGIFRRFWGIEQKELLDALLANKDILTFSLVCKLIFRMSAPDKKNIAVFIDKNPIYYYFLPTIEKNFSTAKYIHLVRDYRANIASYRKAFKADKISKLAYHWVKVNKLIDDRKLKSPEGYCTIKYELLVAEPISAMKEICDFLSIPFYEKMVENHTLSIYPRFKENAKEEFRERHSSLFEPISSMHINKWKNQLTPTEIAEAEGIAGKYGANRFGYVTISDKLPKLNPLKLLLIKIKYILLQNTYRIVFGNISLYYFVKKNAWKDF